MKSIILTTLNAKYAHTSIGLKYLYANLKDLQQISQINEYVVTDNCFDIAEKLLDLQPQIIGIGVYIWNAIAVQKLIHIIKRIAPQTIIILGGPEVSYSPLRVDFSLADYIIAGEGELSFYLLCKTILTNTMPDTKLIPASHVDLAHIELPYAYYTDEDIKNRVIYVEASRGCPFTCEFCLSAADKEVRYFNTDRLLIEFAKLWERGARKFKFLDRTFNLNLFIANRMLDFFLEKTPPYLVHFEVVPDHFPDQLKEKISQFQPASLQFEIGIQTLNPLIAKAIHRNLDLEKMKENIQFLGTATHAHLHLDLIIGLPGESVESFANGLNQLVTWAPHAEIQIGILKKLSGTSIARHDGSYQMIYSGEPPYEILKNELISYQILQKLKRFSRFWDLTYNSGNFNQTVRLLWRDGDVFGGFYAFSEWVYLQTDATFQISLDRLAELLFTYLTTNCGQSHNNVAQLMAEDIFKISGRKLPAFLRSYHSVVSNTQRQTLIPIHQRQQKHI